MSRISFVKGLLHLAYTPCERIPHNRPDTKDRAHVNSIGPSRQGNRAWESVFSIGLVGVWLRLPSQPSPRGAVGLSVETSLAPFGNDVSVRRNPDCDEEQYNPSDTR